MNPIEQRQPRARRGQADRPAPEFEERVVQIDRVARVVKGGRRFRFRATVVIGDRKGRVGLGLGKAGEVQGAIQKAVAVAKKDLITVPSIDGTVPFAVTASHAGAKLLVKPARPGTGIIAGGAVRPVIELSGISNVLSKSLGSDNRINSAKAAILALREVARADISPLLHAAKATAKPAIDAVDQVAEDQPAQTKAAAKSTVTKAASSKTTAKKAKRPTATKAAPKSTTKQTKEPS